jgi:hypothetical protein
MMVYVAGVRCIQYTVMKYTAGAVFAHRVSAPENPEAVMYKIFIDLDGVLADFERGVLRVTGKTVEELETRAMWRALAAYPEFYTGLDCADRPAAR